MADSCDAIIIGAGPAGLATAAALRARGLNAAILEKSDAVGAVWRRHYDRLHLHTDRGHSGLPGLPMPKAYGRYPPRARVVEYLETYAAEFALRPVFNAAVRAVRRDGRGWRAEAGENSQTAPVVVVATGLGWAIDRWFGTRPWGMIVLFFLGVAAGMLNVYRAVTGISGPVGYRTPDGGTAAPKGQWDDEDC